MAFAYPAGPIAQAIAVTANGSYTVSVGVPNILSEWLTVTFDNIHQPGVINASVVPEVAIGILPGTYHSQINLGDGEKLLLSIPVSLTVSGGAVGIAPPSLSFTGNSSLTQRLAISAPLNTVLAASAKTTGGGNWLSLSPCCSVTVFATGGLQLQVTAAADSLAPGLYQGEVDLLPTALDGKQLQGTYQAQKIPVTLTVTPGTISVSPASLSFASQAGTGPPPQQTLTVTATSGQVNGAVTYRSSANWLTVAAVPSGQTTMPASLQVAVNPEGLDVGPHSATISLAQTGAPVATTVPVTYTISPAGSVSASPASLSFRYTPGGTLPAAQPIAVSGNGSVLPFTATASSTGGWLSVSPASGTTAPSGTVALSAAVANPGALAPNQTYQGTITVAGTNAGSGSTTIPVALTISAPLPTLLQVTNAAGYQSGPLAAGEMITLFGAAMGPAAGVPFTPDLMTGGKFPTTLGGVRVLVAGYAAPMLYAGATQISAIVPYEIATPAFLANVPVTVQYGGQSSNGITLAQAAAAPGVFTANARGSGQGAILNSDLSPNSASNPAHPGDTVVLFVTGEGQTIPAGVTGQPTAPAAPFPQPILAPEVTVDGQPAAVSFYAEAPTLVAGILQINVAIPAGARAGDLPIVVKFGDAASQVGVTVAVR